MVIHEQIAVNAPLPVVWRVFTCLDEWNRWNSVCRDSCFLEGDEITEGACVAFTIRPFSLPIRITPRVTRCDPGREVVWEGERLGIHAEHSFSFREEGGTVILTSVEEFSGPFATASALIALPSRLHHLTRQLLIAVKREAEKRAADGGGRCG